MSPKNLMLLALAISSFVVGAVNQYFFPGRVFPPTTLIFTLISAFLIFMWYRLDANGRSYARSLGLNVCVVAVTIVALPYYFFRSRGAAQGFVATLLLVLAYVASYVLTYAGAYSVYLEFQS